MTQSKISQKEITELLTAGFTVQQIAKQRGLTESRIYQIMYSNGSMYVAKNPRPHIRPPSLPAEVKDEYPPDFIPYSVGPGDKLLMRLRKYHTPKDVVEA